MKLEEEKSDRGGLEKYESFLEPKGKILTLNPPSETTEAEMQRTIFYRTMNSTNKIIEIVPEKDVEKA